MSYLRPATIEEALDLLAAEAPRVIAGCTDYFPSRKPGDVDAALMDVTATDGMRGITRDEAGWRIGAATTWTDVIRADLPPGFDALKQAAAEVGSIQIQNRATLAGNLCNASPAADGVPPLLALDAQVEIAAPEGRRQVPLQDFITGVRQTRCAPGELVTAVLIPARAPAETSAFVKLGSRRYLVISIAMVAVNVTLEHGALGAARVAVGACSPVAQRLPALEERLTGCALDDLTGVAFDDPAFYAPLSPISDVRGSAEYRGEVVAALCRRAVLRACGEVA